MSTVGLREKAYNLCRTFLSGSWKTISEDDMGFTAVSGGLSNELFLCSLPSTHTPLNGEPSQVLMRMYGQLHVPQETVTVAPGTNQTKITESVIFMMLSERKLGPKLYGIFPEGRLEEYISARALTCRELADPIISRIIARKLANVHCLDVPITKEPNWLFDNMRSWHESFKSLDKRQLLANGRVQSKSNESIEPKHFNRSAAEFLLKFDFEREIDWLQRFLRTADSPVVFSHNDLQEGNILIPDYLSASKWHGERSPNRSASPPLSADSNNNRHDADIAVKRTQHYLKQLDKNMVLIDFEYCAYNYRGFDLANHFAEWAIDYAQEEFPYYLHQLDQYPSEEQQRMFIDEYLRHYLRENPDQRQLSCNTTDHVLMEVNYFNLATHLLWSIWSVKLALTSQIEFGYWEYGQSRLQAYLDHKHKLLNSI